MACDIHAYVERRTESEWEQVKGLFPCEDWEVKMFGYAYKDSPFDWRSYELFAFLANVRNDYHCTPLSVPRGLPGVLSTGLRTITAKWNDDGHDCSWLLVSELAEFDYRTFFWNRAEKVKTEHDWYTIELAQDEEEEGEMVTYEEFLGPYFFRDLEILKTVDDDWRNVRIVFWFDN